MVRPESARGRNNPRPTSKQVLLNDRIRAVLSAPTANATSHVANGVSTIRMNAGNKKVGASFTLPEGSTCPGQTPSCAKTCYLNFGSFAFPASRNSRNRNYFHVLRLMKLGKGHLAATLAVTAQRHKTLRIHDGGDFFSPSYTAEWVQACRETPKTKYWAYTRSWVVAPILAEIKKLAKLKNVSLWISADRDNWMKAVGCLNANPEFAGIAFMQLPGDEELSKLLASGYTADKVVIFPAHGPGGSHVEVVEDVPNCPAIVAHEQFEQSKEPACVQCWKCLPGGKNAQSKQNS